MKQRLKSHFLAATYTARFTAPARAANRLPGRMFEGYPSCGVCARRSQSAVWLRLPHDRGSNQAGWNPSGGGVEMCDPSGRGFERAGARDSRFGYAYDQSPIAFARTLAIVLGLQPLALARNHLIDCGTKGLTGTNAPIAGIGLAAGDSWRSLLHRR